MKAHSIPVMKQSDRQVEKNYMESPLWMIVFSIALVALILGVMYYFNINEQVVRLLVWIEHHERWSALLFVLVMVAAVVLLLPGVLLTTGAGFVFGVINGTLYVVVGTTIGASLSFLIARYCLGDRARDFIFKRSKIHFITYEMAEHDFKVVLMTRLIPFFPSKISNYFFGLAPFGLRNFILASAVGFIPFSLYNVYLGSIAADLATLQGGSADYAPWQWWSLGLGLCLMIVALYFFQRLARNTLATYSPEITRDEDST